MKDVILLADNDEEVLAELFLGSRLLTQLNCDVFMAGICPARFQPAAASTAQHRPRRPVISARCRREILHRAAQVGWSPGDHNYLWFLLLFMVLSFLELLARSRAVATSRKTRTYSKRAN